MTSHTPAAAAIIWGVRCRKWNPTTWVSRWFRTGNGESCRISRLTMGPAP